MAYCVRSQLNFEVSGVTLQQPDNFGALAHPLEAFGDILTGMDYELLTKLVTQEMSTRGIAKHTGKCQTTIRYWLQKYELKTKPKATSPRRRKPRFCISCEKQLAQYISKFSNIYCNNTCQNNHQYNLYIEKWKSGNISGNVNSGRNLSISNHIRRYLREKHGEQCSMCGWAEYHKLTGKIPTNVDHIDGDPYNSCEENLRILCPNCHSLTTTYGGLNCGKGRIRGKK